jgi:hypothetical protein
MAAPLIYDYRGIDVYKRDEDFLMKALTYKQKKLDANRAKVQNLYDQHSMLDIYKDVDKEYADQRLQKVQDTVNKYSAGDLSSDYLAQNLTQNLGQFVDDNVINAVTSTKLFRSEMNEWATAKKENRDKYRERNKNFVMANNPNLANWLGSDEIGQTYRGGSGFVEYVDYNQKLTEEMPEAIEALGEKWVELEKGSGIYLDQVTKERVPRNRVRRVMEMAIGQDGYRQMQIDAWDESRNYDEGQVRDSYNSYYQSKSDEYTSRANEAKKQLEKETDDEMKSKLSEAISHYENNARIAQEKVESSDELGKTSLYTDLYKKRYEDNVLSAYTYGERVVERKIDKNHFETVKHQFAVRKWEYEKAQEKLKSGGNSGAAGLNGSGILTGTSTITDEELGYNPDQISLVQKTSEQGFKILSELGSTKGFENMGVEDWVAVVGQIDPSTIADKEQAVVKLADGSEKTIDLTDTQFAGNLVKYHNYVNAKSPAMKVYRESIMNLRDNVFIDENGRFDLESAEIAGLNFGHVVKINKDGTKTIEEVNIKKPNNGVKQILTKLSNLNRAKNIGGTAQSAYDENPLTESDRETIKMWKSAGLIMSDNLVEPLRDQSALFFMDELVDNGYSLSDMKRISENRAGLSKGALSNVRELAKSMITSGFGSQNVSSMNSGVVNFFLDVAENQALKFTDRYEPISDDKLEVFDKTSEQFLKRTPSAYYPDTKSFLLNQDSKGYNVVRTQLKLPENFKGVIEAWPEMDKEANKTGNINVKYYSKADNGEMGASKVQVISQEQFKETDITLGDVSFSEYSISLYGEDAPPLSLGSSKVSTEKLQRIQARDGGSENIVAHHPNYWKELDKSISNLDLSTEKENKYNMIKNEFTTGKLKFGLEPNKSTNTYMYTVRNSNGDIVFKQDTGTSDIQQSRVSSLISDQSPIIKSSLISSYIEQEVFSEESNFNF